MHSTPYNRHWLSRNQKFHKNVAFLWESCENSSISVLNQKIWFHITWCEESTRVILVRNFTRQSSMIFWWLRLLLLFPSNQIRGMFLMMPWHFGLEQPKIQTAVLGHSLVRSLAPLTRSLAPDCSLRSCPPLRSLVRSLAPSAALTRSLARSLRSLPRSWESEY